MFYGKSRAVLCCVRYIEHRFINQSMFIHFPSMYTVSKALVSKRKNQIPGSNLILRFDPHFRGSNHYI